MLSYKDTKRKDETQTKTMRKLLNILDENIHFPKECVQKEKIKGKYSTVTNSSIPSIMYLQVNTEKRDSHDCQNEKTRKFNYDDRSERVSHRKRRGVRARIGGRRYLLPIQGAEFGRGKQKSHDSHAGY